MVWWQVESDCAQRLLLWAAILHDGPVVALVYLLCLALSCYPFAVLDTRLILLLTYYTAYPLLRTYLPCCN